MNKMNKTVLVIAALFIGFAAASFLMMKPRVATNLPPDILARSQKYVQTLGSRPLQTLSPDDKLLLLHSYFNLKDYRHAIEVGESEKADLRQLPPDRAKPFISMLKISYLKTGQSEKAAALSDQSR